MKNFVDAAHFCRRVRRHWFGPVASYKLPAAPLACLLVAAIFFSSTVSQAEEADHALRVVFEGEYNTSSAGLLADLRNSDRLAELISLLDDSIRFESELGLVFGKSDGPLFDPQLNEIWMPASFALEVESRFRDAFDIEDADELLQLTEDVLLHTIVHEIGHALIAMYDLPILGKEEDAVDSLGSVILIEHIDQGQAIALSAADMFALESEDRTEFDEADFWSSHSLDAQRYYALLCHVYGSDPDSFEDLVGEDGLGEERAGDCEFEYAKLVDDWYAILDPYLDE